MSKVKWEEIATVKNGGRREIILSGPSISKKIEEEGLDLSLFTLSDLNCLFLTKTCIESVPADLSKLSNLVNLSLHSNKLKSLPPEIGALTKLKNLDVSSNALKDLPSEISTLKELYSVNLGSNQLSSLPNLTLSTKLAVLDLSHNNFNEFPDICHTELSHLSELKLNANEIEVIPSNINVLTSLKVFDISENKLKAVPGELSDLKLKDINLKANPWTDKRFRKLVDQCKPNQVLTYIQQHSPRTSDPGKKDGSGKSKSQEKEKNSSVSENEEEPEESGYTIKVHRPSEISPEVKVSTTVQEARPHIICCVVRDLNLTPGRFSAFIQMQTRLHETVCGKRKLATIASHDLAKIPKGTLDYTTQLPHKLMIKPIGKSKELSGEQLYGKLRKEAEDLRKDKKRKSVSGIHKFLSLLDEKKEYPCLVDASNRVISFPPLTNSDHTKMSAETKDMLLEVTSDSSQTTCRKIMDSLLLECLKLGLGAKVGNKEEIVVEQVRITKDDESLKTVYPSKLDLEYSPVDKVTISRDEL